MFEPQTSIRAFVNKLAIFVTRAKTGDFSLFPHYKEFLATTDSDMSFPSVKCCDRTSRAACAQSFAPWQQATIEITQRDHSIIACSRQTHIFLFFAHIPFVVNHTINATPPERLQQKQDLVQYLTNLQANFKERFLELEEASYRHVQLLFRVDAEACGDLAVEVAELQADENQKIQFEDSDLASFCLNAPKKYTCLKNEATKALVQFGSTYVCEATFSCMVYIKSKYRNRLTDSHLQDNLIIATAVELV